MIQHFNDKQQQIQTNCNDGASHSHNTILLFISSQYMFNLITFREESDDKIHLFNQSMSGTFLSLVRNGALIGKGGLLEKGRL